MYTYSPGATSDCFLAFSQSISCFLDISWFLPISRYICTIQLLPYYRNCWLIIFQLLSKLDFLIDTVPEILNSLPPLFAFILFAPLFAFWLEFDGTTLVEIFCHIGQKFSMSTKHIRVLSFLHIFINLLAFFIKYFLRFLIDNE